MAKLSVRWAILSGAEHGAHALEDVSPLERETFFPSSAPSQTLAPWVRIDGLSQEQATQFVQVVTQLNEKAYKVSSVAEDGTRPIVLLEGAERTFRSLLARLVEFPEVFDCTAALASWWSKIHAERPVWSFRHRKFALGQRIPLLMGIVNVTPDSFSDGGLFFDPSRAIEHALLLAEEGADIIDIGGESTRPGSQFVSVEEELRRVLPIIEALVGRLEIPISIDTTKAAVADAALQAGAEIVNDISMLRFEPDLAKVVAKHDAYYILMHSRHVPETMQEEPFYHSLWNEMLNELEQALALATSHGVDPAKIAVDPGIGFGKRIQDNYRILRELPVLRGLGAPILIGASRKSFLGRVLGLPADERLEGSLAAAAQAALHGSEILRVHDVAPTRKLLQVLDAVRRPPTP